jgi:hypothetical protein
MSIQAKVKLEMVDDAKNRGITFRDLFESIQEEIQNYERLGKLDELMEQKVILTLTDLKGTVLEGYLTLHVGWLEDGNVLLTGNLKDVY